MIATLPTAAADSTSDDELVIEAAKHMIDRFGERALTEVKQRIAELDFYGESGTRDLWNRIYATVEALLGQMADPTRH